MKKEIQQKLKFPKWAQNNVLTATAQITYKKPRLHSLIAIFWERLIERGFDIGDNLKIIINTVEFFKL